MPRQSDWNPEGSDSAGDGSGLLAAAARLDAWHRTELGRPVSADRLRGELGIGSARARELVRQVRDHPGPNGGTDGGTGHQLELAGGPEP